MDKQNMEQFPEGQKDRYTLIINYPVLLAGGIETGLVAVMRHFLREGHRVIWITTREYSGNVAFKGLLDNPKLETVIWEKWSRMFGIPRISFQKEERVIMLSCCAMHYVIGEELKRRADVREFKHYYLVSHFTGEEYYPDQFMKTGLIKNALYRYWQKILTRMVDNDCLRGFAPEHLENYEAYYHVSVPDKAQKILPDFDGGDMCFDVENTEAREKERSDRFVITTCSRFEFPHKAYILGLVDAFRRLKANYPQVVLQIIGGGEGEAALRQKIFTLPAEMQKDIILTGVVSPDDLPGYYRNSHVIVGVAGAVATGAYCSIPSIVVRHYCDVCEAYGFYEDAWEKSLSEEPGEEITPLLEHCITMSAEEYLRHGEEGFLVELKDREAEPNYFFEQWDAKDTVTVQSLGDRLEGRLLYIITELKNRFD